MAELCNFFQIVTSIWSMIEPAVVPYITSALKEMWNGLITYKREKALYSLISKYKKCRVVIDKNDAHEHIELDLNL